MISILEAPLEVNKLQQALNVVQDLSVPLINPQGVFTIVWQLLTLDGYGVVEIHAVVLLAIGV